MRKIMELTKSSRQVFAALLAAAMVFTQSSVMTFAEEAGTSVSDNEVVSEVVDTPEEETVSDETVAPEDESDSGNKEEADEAVEEEDAAEEEAEDAAVEEADEADLEETGVSDDEVVTDLDGMAAVEAFGSATSSSKFYAAIKATENGPQVVLNWSASKKSTRYEVYRMKQDNTMEKLHSGKLSKLTYTDKTSFTKSDASHVYMLVCYKSGDEVARFVTIPKATVTGVDSVKNGTVQMHFVQIKGTPEYPVYYQIHYGTNSSDKYDGRMGEDTVSGNDCETINYGGRDSYTYEITDSNLGTKKTYYFFARAFLDIDTTTGPSTNDLYSTQMKKSVTLKLAGVDIVYIGGHDEEYPEGELHDVCRTDAVMYVEDASYGVSKFSSSDGTSKRYYLVMKAGKTGELSVNQKVRVSDCVRSDLVREDADSPWVVTAYDEDEPETANYRHVRQIRLKEVHANTPISYAVTLATDNGNKVGANGRVYTLLYDFPVVQNPSYIHESAKKVAFTFETEKCAKKYVIFRTRKGFAKPDDAIALVNSYAVDRDETVKEFTKLKDDDGAYVFKKVTTKKNKKNTGEEMTLKDGKVPQTGLYYGYMIVPQDTVLGYESAALLAVKSNIASPKKVKVTSNLNSVKVSWKKVSKAAKYHVCYTTNVDSNGDPVFDIDYHDDDPENIPSDTINDTELLEVNPGTTAYKKCYAIFNSSVLSADETRYFYVLAEDASGHLSYSPAYEAGKLQNVPVTNVTASWKFFSSGSDVFSKRAKITFKTQADYASVDHYNIDIYVDDAATADDTITIGSSSYVSEGKTKKIKKGTVVSLLTTVSDYEFLRGYLYTLKIYPVSTSGIEGIPVEVKLGMPSAIAVLNSKGCLLGNYTSRVNALKNQIKTSYTDQSKATPKELADLLALYQDAKSLQTTRNGCDSDSNKAYRIGGSTRFLIASTPQDEAAYNLYTIKSTSSSVSVEYDPDDLTTMNGKKYHYFTVTPKKDGAKAMIKVYARHYADLKKKASSASVEGSSLTTTQDYFYVRAE